MDCTEVRPLISAYQDGEASPEEEAAVERHLKNCSECRQILAEYRAIGGGMRAMSVPLPPAGLRRDVWRAIEANGRHAAPGAARGGSARPSIAVLEGGRRSSQAAPTITGKGWGRLLPAAGLAAALLLAFASVLFMVNRTSVQAAGLRERSPFTDYGQAIHIDFTRAVKASDVLNFTTIERQEGDSAAPVSDVRKSYDAQTRVLTIQPQATWVPGASYNIVVDAPRIGTGVADQVLADKPIRLQFATLAYTPTPTSTPTETQTPVPTSTVQPTRTPVTAATQQPTAIAQTTQVAPPPASSATAPAATATQQPSSTATNTAVPTSSPTRTPEETATVVPSATLTPHPPTGTPTVVLTPTSVPTKTRPPKPSPTATPTPPLPCDILPVNGFGKLWTENSHVRNRLGCPSARELGITSAAEQHFQGGYMFWRGDTKTIYVFVGIGSGQWYEYQDSWVESEPTPAPDSPPAGLYSPVRGFGKLWRTYPGLRQSLGWATDQEHATAGAWQPFAGGNALWSGSDRKIRLLYDEPESIWEIYNDTYTTPTPGRGE